MAISPIYVARYNEEQLKRLERMIDEQIREGHMVNGTISVTIMEEVPSECVHPLSNAYVKAGWASINVKNSSENGERGGLCCVTLKTEHAKD